MQYGAKLARLIDCRRQLVRRGHCRAAKRRLPYLHRRRDLLQTTTPLGRAVTGTMLVAAMKEDEVNIWATAAPQGQRHRALLPLRPADQPGAQIYKPWLDQLFIDELVAALKMSAFMTKAGFGYKMSAEKAYSTDSNMLGARRRPRTGTPEQRHEIVNPSWAWPSGKTKVAVKREEVTVRFEEGQPVG